MLEVQSGVQLVKKERNAAVKGEIRETLQNMAPGQSFVIEGKIKRNMVKNIASTMNVKIKIANGEDGKLRCEKV